MNDTSTSETRPSPPDTEPEVLIRREGRLGRITLNRPQALNALTLDMVRIITPALAEFAADPGIVAVALDGAGHRGLCAGGDIRALYDAIVAGDRASPETFWREEYQLNAAIAAFPKPYVAFMDGVVMGGGIGLSAHGHPRLVTETTMIAMPECGIGFFPDVGGTYLLSRSPGELGTHVALTAARLGAADAIAVGLADYFLPRALWPEVIAALGRCASSDTVLPTLATFTTAPPAGPLAGHRHWIDQAYAGDSVEHITKRLAALEQPEAQRAAKALAGNSPLTVKVTLAALRRARDLPGLNECLEVEYAMSVPLAFAGDFQEGIRAAVVDKDRKPRWRHAALGDVGPMDVREFFKHAAGHALGLPPTPPKPTPTA